MESYCIFGILDVRWLLVGTERERIEEDETIWILDYYLVYSTHVHVYLKMDLRWTIYYEFIFVYIEWECIQNEVICEYMDIRNALKFEGKQFNRLNLYDEL